MELIRNTILNEVEKSNPILANTLNNEFAITTSLFPDLQKHLFDKFLDLLKSQGKDLHYGIECYLRKNEDLFEERLNFYRTGKYSHSSFKEINESVYNNPEVMKYHTIGLLMLELLISTNYQKLKFQLETLQTLKAKISKYLEIGGGHGMYLWQAEKILSKHVTYDLVDISKISIDIAKFFLKDIPVNYYHQDIFSFSSHTRYDFISMCEILEHLEKPGDLVLKAMTLLNRDGRMFITVPINSPAIDHIYLFESVEKVRTLLRQNGLAIINEKSVPKYEMSMIEVEKMKLPINYFALVKNANEENKI